VFTAPLVCGTKCRVCLKLSNKSSSWWIWSLLFDCWSCCQCCHIICWKSLGRCILRNPLELAPPAAWFALSRSASIASMSQTQSMKRNAMSHKTCAPILILRPSSPTGSKNSWICSKHLNHNSV
jgi:hypothetical protein